MRKLKKINIKKAVISLLMFLAGGSVFLLFNPKVSQAVPTWTYEGEVYHVYTIQQPGTVPVYRFWSDQHASHFYTASADEKDYVIQTWPEVWTYEGVAFYVYSIQQPYTKPVYRFWSNQFASHFYTISEEEKDHLVDYEGHVWQYEGVAFYAYGWQTGSSTGVYRFWSPKFASHFYTASKDERDYVIEHWSKDEEKDNYGPTIRVGILKYDKDYSKDHSIKVEASKDYVIKDEDGDIIATVDKDDVTKVKYESGGELRVYNSIDETMVDGQVDFEAADGNNLDLIFKVEPMNFDDYRGKIRIKYSDNSKSVWAINILPLEQYVWGMGEITGTGPMEYNKVMTVNFRTYGYKKITHGVVNKADGFDVDTTAGNQIYYGYDWEVRYPRIKEGAEETWGEMVTYDDEPVWTPYSSSTDGRTRSWAEVWGGNNHEYCQSVDDPWGKVDGAGSIPGNHMVGVSARGALNQAKEDDEDYDDILTYYYTDVDIDKMY